MELKLAENKHELRAILKIQEENHVKALSLEFSKNKGFVTVQHSFEMLQKLNEKAPHIIAKCHEEVIGYALVMLTEFKDLVPVLIPMFKMFERINYQETPLTRLNFYVMGQICIKDGFKRQGIFKKLYAKHKEVYGGQFDYCVTEVSSRNIPSMRAHEKIGFKIIHTFKDETDEWHILLWDWS